MYHCFPTAFLDFLRCPKDAGRLICSTGEDAIAQGMVRCESCGRPFPVRDGLLDLLPELDHISAHEAFTRDEEAAVFYHNFSRAEVRRLMEPWFRVRRFAPSKCLPFLPGEWVFLQLE